MRINDTQLLKNAFLDASLIEMRTLLDGAENDEYDFSLEFEEKISSVIEKIRKPKKRLSKRKIVAILIAAAILVSLMFTVVAFGDRIGSFIINITDKAFDFGMKSEDGYPKAIETKYYPTYIPEGFDIVGGHDYSVEKEYRLSDGTSKIVFRQQIITEGTISVSNEGDGYQLYNVGDITVYCFDIERSDVYIMVWEYNKYAFVMKFSKCIGVEEGFKIIESIQEKQ